jgi:hypothetical protein
MYLGARTVDEEPRPDHEGQNPDTNQAANSAASLTVGPVVVLHCPSIAERQGRPPHCKFQYLIR